VLRQDPVECLFSFICSSNNHISRIAGMVERLCSAYGTPLPLTTDDTAVEPGAQVLLRPVPTPVAGPPSVEAVSAHQGCRSRAV